MREIDEGRAKLKGLTVHGEFDVKYKLVYCSRLEQERAGYPPVRRFEATVEYIRSLDGRRMPPGEYLLERESEVNRLKNIGANTWHVLSWPRG